MGVLFIYIAYMLSALYAIASPFICLSVTRADQPKTDKLRL